MKEFMFENGESVKDSIIGFKGVVIGRADYITGCNQYLVLPKTEDCKEKYPEASWLDENRLIKIKVKKVTVGASKKDGPCGTAPIK